MSAEDLAAYQPVWSEALHTTYRGYDVYSTPPTYRGGLEVLMQLNLVESYDLKSLGAEAPRRCTSRPKRSRSRRPTSTATSPTLDSRVFPRSRCFLRSTPPRRKLIDASKAGPYPEPGTPRGRSVRSGHSTHPGARASSKATRQASPSWIRPAMPLSARRR